MNNIDKSYSVDEIEAIRTHWAATLYDQQETQTDDVEFLLTLVGRESWHIFEVCCGSGRILIPLAQAGYRVEGLDRNPEMLANLARKARELRLDHLRFWQADAVRCDWGGPYDIAVLGGNILINIETDLDYTAAQQLFIHKAATCLKQGGYLFLDFDLHRHPEAVFGQKTARVHFDGTDDRGVYGRYIALSGTYDSETQTTEGPNRTELTLPDGTNLDILGCYSKHIPSLADVHAWLGESGFAVQAEYGDYRKRPIGEDTHRATIWARLTDPAPMV